MGAEMTSWRLIIVARPNDGGRERHVFWHPAICAEDEGAAVSLGCNISRLG